MNNEPPPIDMRARQEATSQRHASEREVHERQAARERDKTVTTLRWWITTGIAVLALAMSSYNACRPPVAPVVFLVPSSTVAVPSGASPAPLPTAPAAPAEPAGPR